MIVMFYKYLIAESEGIPVLYLYVSDLFPLPTNDSIHWLNESIYQLVYNYIKRNKISFSGDKVSLVRNEIILASIYLSDYDVNHRKKVETIEATSHKLISKNSLDLIEQLKLEEYIFGVVSGEMPAIFQEEALKAQAVIARTYAMKRISRNLPIRHFNSTQIYRDKNYLKDIWGNHYDEYRTKILKAIRDTEHEVIKFEGDYIDSYYHLASNGRTEDSSNVLKLAYPYLVSVDSSFELDSDNVGYRVVPNDYLSKLLNVPIQENTEIELLMKTIGHRVKYIRFGDKVFDGLLLARRLGLNSNDFSVSIGRDATTFTTRGYGHGLGLSKYGAEGMAKSGYNYYQILNHYYPNTYIEKEDNF